MDRARSMSRRAVWLLAATPLVLLLTHDAAVLPHEFSHSVAAWLLGLKDRPGHIDWGGSSLLNILLLIHIDENVAYTAALHAGKDWRVAVVAVAGPGLANGGLYLLARRLIAARRVARRPVVAYGLCWFLFMNLANLYDYVPLRVFAADGDVKHFRLATGISPWAIYAVGGYLVAWGLVDFYRVVLPRSLDACGLTARWARGAVLIVATGLMFGYFAIPGLEEADAVSLFMARSSLLAIPVVVALTWRLAVASAAASAVPRPALDAIEPAAGVAYEPS